MVTLGNRRSGLVGYSEVKLGDVRYAEAC